MANTHAIDLEVGSTQYLSRADEALTSITGNMTIECWIQPESLPSDGNTMTLVAKNKIAAGARGYRFGFLNASGVYSLFWENSANGTAVTNCSVTFTVATGTYVHVAVVYTAAAGTVDFYVNGAHQGTQQTGLGTSIFDNTIAFQVGANVDAADAPTSMFDGLIDELRLWSVARTSAQISANYTTETPTPTTGLVGHWHFNNALTSEVNTLTLTNNGTAVFSAQPAFLEVKETAGTPVDGVVGSTLVFTHTITKSDTAGTPTEDLDTRYGWGEQTRNSTTWTEQTKT